MKDFLLVMALLAVGVLVFMNSKHQNDVETARGILGTLQTEKSQLEMQVAGLTRENQQLKSQMQFVEGKLSQTQSEVTTLSQLKTPVPVQATPVPKNWIERKVDQGSSLDRKF